MRLLCSLLLLAAQAAAAQAIHGRGGILLPAPPPAEAIPVSDNYFGTRVVDNYRWLEDANSPETQAFIDAQNACTTRYMKQAGIRSQAVDDLTGLESASTMSLPLQRGEALFYLKRLAGEQQASIYVRRPAKAPSAKTSAATSAAPPQEKRLVDPATFTTDPNISVQIEDVSRDGALLAYAVRTGGADEASIRITNTTTGKPLEEELPTARYFSIAFTPDGSGFY